MVRIQSLTIFMLLGLVFGALGCVSESTTTEDYGDLSARRSKPQGSWQVWQGSRLSGYVVRFEEAGSGGSVLLSVRNDHNQDLGWIDQLGRAWRYRPHEDPEWVSTGSTLQGVRNILELDRSTRLQACSLDDLPSDR